MICGIWDADDAVARQAAAEYAKSRQSFCVKISGVSVACLIVLNIYWGLGDFVLGFTLFDANFHHLTVTGGGLVMLLLVHYPALHNVRGLPLSYFFFVALACVWVSPDVRTTMESQSRKNAVGMLLMVCASPAGGIAVIPGSIIFFVVASIYQANMGGVLRFGYFTIMFIASNSMVLYAASGVRVAMDAKAVRNESQALSSLLASICDAVVELDESGKILSDSTTLSNLMFLKGSPQGMQLGRFMASDEDRDSFLKMLESQEEAAPTTVVRHTDMKDTCGTRVQVEIFLVPFLSVDFSRRFLVGIREHADVASRMPGEGTYWSPGMPNVQSASFEDSEEGKEEGSWSFSSISELSIPGGGEPAQTPCPAMLSIVGDERVRGRATVWVDTTSTDMGMVQCTEGFFTQFGGPNLVQGARFCSWITPRERAGFVGQVQKAGNKLLGGSEPMVLRVRLRPKSLGPFVAKVRMEMELDLEREDPLSLVKFTITSLKLCPAHRPASGRGAQHPPMGARGSELLQDAAPSSSVGSGRSRGSGRGRAPASGAEHAELVLSESLLLRLGFRSALPRPVEGGISL